MNAPMVYLGRSRLHRSRANLIQTLNTVAGLRANGVGVRLVLPPWPASHDASETSRLLGISPPVEIESSSLLHPRYGFWPYVLWHRRGLRQSAPVYTRVPEIGAALGRFGIAYALEVHNVDELLTSTAGERVLQHCQAGLVRKLIPISGNGARLLQDAGVAGELLHVAHSGVRPEAYAHIPPFDPARLDSPRIVHLGRLVADRGLHVFEAVSRLAGVSITIVGGECGLAGATNLPLVPCREVPDLYGQSDLTLIPYQPDIETVATMSPIKLFEALAAGRPIIASDLPTIREVLVHERDALLVPPRDLDAWVSAVERLRGDRALAARLAARTQELVGQYSWQARARGIADALGLSGE
ncbi:MAG: glycosyltransferase family 4 protein [Victivallales bacterium]|nr:glycosyltransferase family 4 protein [Victivallales bacterium]